MLHPFDNELSLINFVLEQCRQDKITEYNPNSADEMTAFASKAFRIVTLEALNMRKTEWTFAHSLPVQLDYVGESPLVSFDTEWEVPIAAGDYIKVSDVFPAKNHQGTIVGAFRWKVLLEGSIHTNFKSRDSDGDPRNGDVVATLLIVPEVGVWSFEFCNIVRRLLEGLILRKQHRDFKEESSYLEIARQYAALEDEKYKDDCNTTVRIEI